MRKFLQVECEEDSLHERKANVMALGVLWRQAAQRQFPLMRLEIEGVGRLGQVGEKGKAKDGHWEGDEAVNDEGLLPN